MKFRFLILMLSFIVILSTAFTPTTKVTDGKPTNHLKVMKDVLTLDGNLEQVVIAELKNYTAKERDEFIARILKSNKIAFQCKACTSWKGDSQGSGWCSRLCCYPGPSGCSFVVQETAECCAIPPDELSC
jgi:hypothetical protein